MICSNDVFIIDIAKVLNFIFIKIYSINIVIPIVPTETETIRIESLQTAFEDGLNVQRVVKNIYPCVVIST